MMAGMAMGARESDIVKSMPFGCDMKTKWYSGYLRTNSAQRWLHYVFVESAA